MEEDLKKTAKHKLREETSEEPLEHSSEDVTLAMDRYLDSLFSPFEAKWFSVRSIEI